MKIDLYGSATTGSTQQVDNSSASRALSVKSQENAQQVAAEDKTTFTAHSATVQKLTKTAIETFPSRESKVESLRQAVNSAQYQLDADKIAESLINAEV